MATNYFEIPLTPQAQRFLVTLAGVQYRMALVWRTNDLGGWFLDLSDSAGNPLVQGIPLVTSVDLLAQYPDLAIGGRLVVASDNDPQAVPTYENLGTESRLYFAVDS